MHQPKPTSHIPAASRPRHAHQEIVDLLAIGLLRLRARGEVEVSGTREQVDLGFVGQERVNANPDDHEGVRP
ncbi:hypothetical protein [Caldimonas taiwanensis]|uniref:hypothetical protein n=1 Tax=Caldimonas taiwanensis TaxID=307483 RepID=UPI0009FCE2DB|nr:hypothetical protein [Caldimonas taiwanensis]